MSIYKIDYVKTLHLFVRNADKHKGFHGKGEGPFA